MSITGGGVEYLSWHRATGPPRHAARRARPVPLACTGGGLRAGRRGAPRARPRAGGEARADGRADVEVAVDERPRYVSRGGTSSPTRWTPAASTSPAGARWTSAPRPAASPTCCCSAARTTWSRSTSPTASSTGGCATTTRVTVLERTNARALEPARRCPTRRICVVARRLVHLAGKVLPAVLGVRGRRASTRWRWSSRSSRSGAGASARAAWSASRPTGARRSSRSATAAQELGASVLGFASLGAARARRATARRSSGSPRAAGRRGRRRRGRRRGGRAV